MRGGRRAPGQRTPERAAASGGRRPQTPDADSGHPAPDAGRRTPDSDARLRPGQPFGTSSTKAVPAAR